MDARDYYLAFYEAARRAERSILLLGWQFDSDVQLLRGDDVARGATGDAYELMSLLDGLCRERPELEVRILAWDHSVIFALEREILQKIVFDMTTCERVTFRFDSSAPYLASHHQKVAIIDGRIAFVGSADLAQCRWDTSEHQADDPRRIARGEPYKPYHEVQLVVGGEPVQSLLQLFAARWEGATGEALDVASLIAPHRTDDEEPLAAFAVRPTVAMPRACLSLSRTLPPGEDGEDAVHEVRGLYVEAIGRAERLIYIETQYLTASAVRDALVDRMRDPTRPRLEVVVVLPRRPEKPKEELTVGQAQTETLELLTKVARETGHAFGTYNVASVDGGGQDVFVYIHSKLMIVDDRFFTMGSANLTNRSMNLDSEINVTYEATGEDDDALREALRAVRVRLLGEHVGRPPGAMDVEALLEPDGLVARLDALADAREGNLRRHEGSPLPTGPLARVVKELALEYLDPDDRRPPLAPGLR